MLRPVGNINLGSTCCGFMDLLIIIIPISSIGVVSRPTIWSFIYIWVSLLIIYFQSRSQRNIDQQCTRRPLTPTYLTPNKRHGLVLTVKTKVWQIFTRRTNFPFLSTAVHWTESNFGKNEKRWQTRAESKYKHYSDPFYMFSSSYISVLCVSL